MPVTQQGQINTTALIVPDLYVQIVPPTVALLNGIPSNILGIVGTAQWGPVNSPVPFSSMADYASLFGDIQNRKYDMGTIAATAVGTAGTIAAAPFEGPYRSRAVDYRYGGSYAYAGEPGRDSGYYGTYNYNGTPIANSPNYDARNGFACRPGTITKLGNERMICQ